MKADRPKQYLPLAGRMLMDHTLNTFLSHPSFESIVLVLSADDPYFSNTEFAGDTRIIRANGGRERSDSVLNGLNAIRHLASDEDWVLVHDVARPCLTHSDIHRLLENRLHPGAILATPTRDTMKRGRLSAVNSQGSGCVEIDHTVEREQLWHALTPQLFPYGLLRNALNYCLEQQLMVTDEASAIEHMGYAPKLVEGRADNIKVTRPEDLALAELFLNNLKGTTDPGESS